MAVGRRNNRIPKRRYVLGLGLIGLMLVTGCRTVSDSHELVDPATIEEIPGEGISKVTLTASAAKRLDIQTESVTEVDGERAVPSSALIIDPEGGFWVYTADEPLVYVRARLEDVHQDGNTTFFLSGPETGTDVVTIGVPELYGAESGIGH